MGSHRAVHRSPRRAAGQSTPDAVTSDVHAARSAGGKRRATRRTPQRTRIRPSAPTVFGGIALIAAAAGSVAFGQGDLHDADGLQSVSGSSHRYTGTDALTVDDDSRSLAISRDFERQAKQEAASADLKVTVEKQAARRTAQLASLAESAERRADQIAKNLWVLPMVGYRLTAYFGAVGLWSSTHTGLDFAGPTGTPIQAVASGVITEAGYQGAYGNKTVQTLADGTEIWYCHQDSLNVQVGDRVVQGEQIGTVGSTGNVTGPHLHLEVHPGGGDPVDPYSALAYHGVSP